ncbi:hypothetical protein B0H10DRAFT_2137542 [Mycena sp. CBHHK59/15]|nr:hypothetical protein B0H10DRAFT_2137542 [Mycena sp. CBHHK59/15]
MPNPPKIDESDTTIVAAQAEPTASDGRQSTPESASAAEPPKTESAKIKDTSISEPDEIKWMEPPQPPRDVPRGKITNTISGKPSGGKPRPPPK